MSSTDLLMTARMAAPSEITSIPTSSNPEQGVIHFQDGAGVYSTELLKVADTESDAKVSGSKQFGPGATSLSDSDTVSKSYIASIRAGI